MARHNKKMDVVVVGELNVDVIFTGLPSLPVMGDCLMAKDMEFTLGSASAIFAANIAGLNQKVGFVGKTGDDLLAEFIIAKLRDLGVDTIRIKRDKDAKTGLCVSLSFPENYAMASYPGVRETMTAGDVPFEYVRQAGHLHMSSYYLQPGMIPGCPELFRRAKEAGLSTSLDPDADSSGRWSRSIFDLLKHVDIFLPNEREALSVTGKTHLGRACEVLQKYCKIVAVKRGADGAVVYCGGKKFACRAFPAVPVDTTGAGDSFNAGFLARFIGGADLEECAIWGNACGALSTRAAGGTAAFPSLRELDSYLQKNRADVVIKPL